MPPGRKELYCAQWRWLFDAGPATLESFSAGKSTCCSTLRCHMLPSRENFPTLILTYSVNELDNIGMRQIIFNEVT